jgi:hypothetical protein
MKDKINVIGTVKRASLKGVAQDAQYALLGPEGKIIKFYKLGTVRFNDQSQEETLFYLSETPGNGWVRSNYNKGEADYHKLKRQKFNRIA